MPRHKKDAHPISLRMDQATYDRLDAFCDRAGQPKTVAIERAVNLYIDRYDIAILAASLSGMSQSILMEKGLLFTRRNIWPNA
jgi:predicted DNA-binding protein